MKLRFPLASSDKAEKRNERKSWKIRENITLTLLVVAPWQRVCVCVGACVSCLFYSLFTLHINWNLRASPRFSFSSSLLLFLLLLSVAPLWQFSWLPVFYFILFFSCIFLHFLLVCVAHIALMNFSLWVMQGMSEEKWKRERGRGGAIKTYLAKLQQSKWRIWKFA